MTGTSSRQYGFQPMATTSHTEGPVHQPRYAFTPENVAAIAAGRIRPPQSFWTSYDPETVQLRQAVQEIIRKERAAEERERDLRFAAEDLVRDAREGRYGTVAVTLRYDERGKPYATHVRFPDSTDVMTVEQAFDAGLLR